MCCRRLSIIIFVLTPLKFTVTLSHFIRIYSYTNFIFGTVTYCSLSSCCCCSLASSSATFSSMCFNHFRRDSVFPPFCYIIKEQFHLHFAVFLQLCLVLMSLVHKFASLFLILLVMFIIHF